jgi:hypothetical protein
MTRIFDCDLRLAGIAKRDDRGRTLDVHSLRHTFATWLSASGVTPRTAQAALRHSTLDLTMQVYTDPRLLDVAGALDVLPDLPLGQPDREAAQPAVAAAGGGIAGPMRATGQAIARKTTSQHALAAERLTGGETAARRKAVGRQGGQGDKADRETGLFDPARMAAAATFPVEGVGMQAAAGTSGAVAGASGAVTERPRDSSENVGLRREEVRALPPNLAPAADLSGQSLSVNGKIDALEVCVNLGKEDDLTSDSVNVCETLSTIGKGWLKGFEPSTLRATI